ncbi:MAG: hypothetical protein ACR2L2_20605 [Acidobacteriota bacterium]
MNRHAVCLVGLLCMALSATGLQAQSDLAFPHVVVGGPWETILQVTSEVGATVTVVVDVFQGGSTGASNGLPMAVRFDGSAPTSSRTVNLSAFEELSTVLSTADTTARNGWARVRSTTAASKISGNLIFRQRSGATVLDSVAVASPQRFKSATIQIDNREVGSNTGLAFVNPDSTPLAVHIDLYRANLRIETLTVTLQPNQHFAKFVTEIFGGFGAQQGTLVLDVAGDGTAIPFLTLRADGAQFTGIPVRPSGGVAQYEVRNSANAVVETGLWIFDQLGSNLVGLGRRNSDPVGSFFVVSGSFEAAGLQISHRVQFPNSSFGVVVFQSTTESNAGLTGKVTTIGADGQVVSVNNFTVVEVAPRAE